MENKAIWIEHNTRIDCRIKNNDTLVFGMKHEFNVVVGEIKRDEAIELRNFLNEFIEKQNGK